MFRETMVDYNVQNLKLAAYGKIVRPDSTVRVWADL